MPWIKTVKVQEDDPQLSKWTLSTNQFGRDWEFSWFALNMTPLRNQKIHWRSVPGSTGGSLGSSIEVANRGQIRFSKKGPEVCTVKLTISYEVPSVLAPFANVSNSGWASEEAGGKLFFSSIIITNIHFISYFFSQYSY